jgi:phytoene desaturase
MVRDEPIVIVGGGIGGLTAAIRLAKKNYNIVLIEKNEKVGGKMSEVRQDGFRWDTGPSVITMRKVLEELFEYSGKKLNDYLQLLPIDPLTRYFFSDGKKLEIWRDLTRTIDSISSISPEDIEGYLRFLAYSARQYQLTSPIYIYSQAPSWNSFLKIGLRDLLSVDIFRDYYSAIQDHVKSPAMRQFLARFATYIGANPYQAPALLSVIAYVELIGGVWYPRGGTSGIAGALERLAVELKVKILKSKRVTGILLRQKAVAGVVLDDGTSIGTDCVISNVDVATTYASLLPAKPPYSWHLENISKQPSSYSAYILLWGVKGKHSELAHHNILFSDNYHQEFRDISAGIPPKNPTLYIAITSKTDAHHAPAGHENWFVMAIVPPLNSKFDWTDQSEGYKKVVFDSLKKFGFDVRDQIVTERVFTPIDLQDQSGSYRGALYGSSPSDLMSMIRRPRPEAANIPGLYFVGGTTHPGGGVPMVMLSGKNTAEIVDAELKKVESGSNQ